MASSLNLLGHLQLKLHCTQSQKRLPSHLKVSPTQRPNISKLQQNLSLRKKVSMQLTL
jgi:hypothetical protein